MPIDINKPSEAAVRLSALIRAAADTSAVTIIKKENVVANLGLRSDLALACQIELLLGEDVMAAALAGPLQDFSSK